MEASPKLHIDPPTWQELPSTKGLIQCLAKHKWNRKPGLKITSSQAVWKTVCMPKAEPFRRDKRGHLQATSLWIYVEPKM